jgi:hypothetical protein
MLPMCSSGPTLLVTYRLYLFGRVGQAFGFHHFCMSHERRRAKT